MYGHDDVLQSCVVVLISLLTVKLMALSKRLSDNQTRAAAASSHGRPSDWFQQIAMVRSYDNYFNTPPSKTMAITMIRVCLHFPCVTTTTDHLQLSSESFKSALFVTIQIVRKSIGRILWHIQYTILYRPLFRRQLIRLASY